MKQSNLHPGFESFFKEKNFSKLTEIQEKTLLKSLRGESLSVLAPTGSGKTLSYLIPVFEKLKKNDNDIPMESQYGSPRALIISPTRELNQQIFKGSKSIAHHVKLRVRQLVGGRKTQNRLNKDQAYDILIASPSTISKAILSKELSLELLEVLVFDEADQLLEMGFFKELKLLTEKVDPKLQVLLYSATWPAQYQEFIKNLFPEKKFKDIVIQGGNQVQRNIETFNIRLKVFEKKDVLKQFVKEKAKGKGIIFVNKKEDIVKIQDHLKNEFPQKKIHSLHGGLQTRERKQAYELFLKEGGILLASDVVARGMDIQNLNWILNYDLPFESVYYIHRCGRTGRHGKTGLVYNFVTPSDSKLIERINQSILSQSSLALKTFDLVKLKKKKASPKKKAPIKKKPVKKKVKKSKKSPRFARKKKK